MFLSVSVTPYFFKRGQRWRGAADKWRQIKTQIRLCWKVLTAEMSVWRSLWIPKGSYVSRYKARSIYLRWLDFSGEGAIGGNMQPQQMRQLFQDFSCLAITRPLKGLLFFFFLKGVEYLWVCHEKPMESSPHTFSRSCCRGLLGLLCFCFLPGLSETWSFTSASLCGSQSSRLL